MKDDFLHRMRVNPPPGFLADLKSRLDRQAHDTPEDQRAQQTADARGWAWGRTRAMGRSAQPSAARMLLLGLLLGGSAFALASWSIQGFPTNIVVWLRDKVAPASQSPDPKTPTRGWVWSAAAGNGHAGSVPDPGRPGQVPWQFAEPPASDSATSTQAGSGPAGPVVQNLDAGGSSPIVTAAGAALADPRDYILIVDSDAVHPYTTAVVDHFNVGPFFKPPKVTTAVTAAALAQLCAGRSYNFPDIATTSRRITPSEYLSCREKGVVLTEAKLGVEAVVVARSRLYGPLKLTSRDLFLALAAEVPVPGRASDGLIRNPYTTWNQIDPELPDDRIKIIGPVLTSSMGKVFTELLLEAGCQAYPVFSALQNTDESRYHTICGTVRRDIDYVEFPDGVGGPSFIERLTTEPTAIGLFKYGFGDSQYKLAVSPVDGVLPTADAIASQRYPISRTLYLYVTDSHQFVPNLGRLVTSYLWPNDLWTVGGWALTAPDVTERKAIFFNAAYFKPLTF